MFFKLGSVVELLGVASALREGSDDFDRMDENEIRAAVVCAGVVVDEVAMRIHDMADRLMVALPFAGEEIPHLEDEGQGDVLNHSEI